MSRSVSLQDKFDTMFRPTTLCGNDVLIAPDDVVQAVCETDQSLHYEASYISRCSVSIIQTWFRYERHYHRVSR